MRFAQPILLLLNLFFLTRAFPALPTQIPLLRHADNRTVSAKLFAELEELARVVDISYCIGLTGLGIAKPFQCLSRCSDFPNFELVKRWQAWNTGPLMSDSCGYIALSHSPSPPRIIVAFRGTYSIANTIIDLSTVPQEYVPYSGGDDGFATPEARCDNCTVHSGFHTSWLVTRASILADLETAIALHPGYKLTLVGHSLGGAIAALAGLDFRARGWDPVVTTFGEPRIGNRGLNAYLDARFGLTAGNAADEDALRYRRVTHVDDPVPLLPLKDWGYAMHAGEIFISKAELSPEVEDLRHCTGHSDQRCIARGDAAFLTTAAVGGQYHDPDGLAWLESSHDDGGLWNIPTRYKLWQLFFAHRDYFWRLGLCVPGGDPRGWF
ncbi:hypothetical protein LTR66_012222 [Elasticomyces elasticus]|nr:hypothetical protein LTR66_012222 [Elasticomyces elasticus]